MSTLFVTKPDERLLYSLPLRGRRDETLHLLVPVPSDEALTLVTQHIGCIGTPAPVVGSAARWAWLRASPPTKSELSVAFDHLASLADVDVNLVAAIAKAVEVTPNLNLRYAFACILRDLTMGLSAGVAFSSHPDVFDKGILGQMAAADETGSIAGTLRSISKQLQQTKRTIDSLVMACVYPAGLSCALYTVLAVFEYYGVPQLAQTLRSLNARLFLTTKVLLAMGETAKAQPWTLGLVPCVVVVAFLLRRWLLPPLMRLGRRVPVYGGHYQDAILTNSAITLSGILSNNAPMSSALGIVAEVSDDVVLKHAFFDAQAAMASGERASIAMLSIMDAFGRRAQLLLTAVQVGEGAESTGAMKVALAKAAAAYEYDFAKKSERLQKLAEPLATVVLGLCVGTIATSFLLPIFQATANAGR